MDQAIKQFTLIDFLGIFTPGAIMLLAVNYYVLDITAPIRQFFGDNAVMMALCFIILSYLCGSALHELGGLLECGMREIRPCKGRDMHKKHYEKAGLNCAYKTCFGEDFPTDEEKRQEAGREIFHWVQKKTRPQRIVMFTAFYTMSRTLVVTLLLLLFLTFFSGLNDLCNAACLIGLYALGIVIFLFRWIAFEQKCIDEAYMIFITDNQR